MLEIVLSMYVGAKRLLAQPKGNTNARMYYLRRRKDPHIQTAELIEQSTPYCLYKVWELKHPRSVIRTLKTPDILTRGEL